ncbi:stachyose synthase [Olea europaea subsp. europaea]|uniref:Stachyose synthase n=1 Tax=Olea europaea subsp. europaea TaxID=158383 RepID=A0A8S0UAK7_OLEEU|nr:stachyose synthase [Olea europaea subsp. europaea]
MAPPDYPANSNFRVHKSSERCDLLELVDGELCVGNVRLHTEIPSNVTFKVSLQYAISLMLSLHCLSASNPCLSREDFLDSARRFKTWWGVYSMGREFSLGFNDGKTMDNVKESTFDAIAYAHVFENPYNLMEEAYRAIRIHIDTFKLLEEKSVPPLINKFGWCTWDAFYMTVEPAGIWHGVIEFLDGGLSLRFLIIDDGSQNVNFDGKKPK